MISFVDVGVYAPGGGGAFLAEESLLGLHFLVELRTLRQVDPPIQQHPVYTVG